MTAVVTESCTSGQYVTEMAVTADVWTGAGTSAPAGAVASGTAASAAALSATVTPHAAGSALCLTCAAGNTSGVTAGSGDYARAGGTVTSASFACEWAGMPAGPALTASTSAQSLTAAAATAGTWAYVAYEVLAAAATGYTLTAAATDTVTAQTGTATASFTVSGGTGGTQAAASAATGTATALSTVTAAGSLVILSPPVLPGVNYGQAYPGITLAAGGGTPPYAWSVTSGALPAGFTLSPAGVLAGGTPSSGAGTSGFTVKVTDSAGHAATQASSVTITSGTVQVITTNAQVNGSGTWYGSNQSAVSGGWGITADEQDATGVLQSQAISYYDPGNWTVTARETGPQQSPANTGAVYTGPEVFQYFNIGAWGTTEPPLSHFTSLTTSYSQVAPAPNGISWPDEGAQAWEFCYDIWLNGFATEIMIWTHTEGPRFPWDGHPVAGDAPIPLTNPVSIAAGGLTVPYGQLVTINCGPGGTPVTYAFSYNFAVNTAQGTGVSCPRGPFNFVQVSGPSAFRNTDQGFINLAGGGNGLLDWLSGYGYIGGTAGGAPAPYTPTMCGINYGVEICSTGGTDYPALTFGFTSFTVNASPVWTG
jgi:hypothetical protein